MSKGRKSVIEDAAVKAALAHLREAILAVNGDAEIVGMITLVQIGNPDGTRLVSDVRSCSCMECMQRNYRQFTEAMASHVSGAVARGGKEKH